MTVHVNPDFWAGVVVGGVGTFALVLLIILIWALMGGRGYQ